MKMYVFTQEDLEYVQNLLPEEVEVFLKDDNTIMDTRYNKRNNYVESVTFNFSWDFIDEIKKYFSKIGNVTFNNTATCWWIFY